MLNTYINNNSNNCAFQDPSFFRALIFLQNISNTHRNSCDPQCSDIRDFKQKILNEIWDNDVGFGSEYWQL